MEISTTDLTARLAESKTATVTKLLLVFSCPNVAAVTSVNYILKLHLIDSKMY